MSDFELNKKTVISVDWMKKKGLSGCKVTTTGKKLPRNIKVMLVNQLLNELKIDIRVER